MDEEYIRSEEKKAFDIVGAFCRVFHCKFVYIFSVVDKDHTVMCAARTRSAFLDNLNHKVSFQEFVIKVVCLDFDSTYYFENVPRDKADILYSRHGTPTSFERVGLIKNLYHQIDKAPLSEKSGLKNTLEFFLNELLKF